MNRVLLADPNSQLLEIYAEALSAAGYAVTRACDALHCVDELRHAAPDVLVLEPALPWGQGEGVLSYMREESDVPMVPVIVLTSGADLLEEFRWPRFPVVERHQKPLAAADLVHSVQHALRSMSAP